MHKFKIAIAAAALALAGSTAAFADSAIDALSSANGVSFGTVTPAEELLVRAGVGKFELVDVDSLKARIAQDPKLLMQLEEFGSSLDDVVGITGNNSTDVTILVRG